MAEHAQTTHMTCMNTFCNRILICHVMSCHCHVILLVNGENVVRDFSPACFKHLAAGGEYNILLVLPTLYKDIVKGETRLSFHSFQGLACQTTSSPFDFHLPMYVAKGLGKLELSPLTHKVLTVYIHTIVCMHA